MNKYLLFLALLLENGLSHSTDRILLRLLRANNDNLKFSLHDFHLFTRGFIEDISKLNLRSSIMSEIWNFILLYKPANKMTVEDWTTYGSILGSLPQEAVYQINVTDEKLVGFFGTVQNLNIWQLVIIGDMLKNTHRWDMFNNASEIFRLRNIVCGFSIGDLKKIPPHVFRALAERDFFKFVWGCTRERLEAFLEVGVQYAAIGPPTTWSADTVRSAGYLLAGLDETRILHIRDKSCRGIRTEVIQAIPVEVLSGMRPAQIKELPREGLLAWRRKTKNLVRLSSKSGLVFDTALLICLLLLVFIIAA